MGDAVKPLGSFQQLGLAHSGGMKCVLRLGELGRKLRHTHPQSIPEALARLEWNARLCRDSTFSGRREKA
jgi:hypothetical protein